MNAKFRFNGKTENMRIPSNIDRHEMLDMFGTLFGTIPTLINISTDENKAEWIRIDGNLASHLKENETYDVKGYLFFGFFFFSLIFCCCNFFI